MGNAMQQQPKEEIKKLNQKKKYSDIVLSQKYQNSLFSPKNGATIISGSVVNKPQLQGVQSEKKYEIIKLPPIHNKTEVLNQTQYFSQRTNTFGASVRPKTSHSLYKKREKDEDDPCQRKNTFMIFDNDREDDEEEVQNQEKLIQNEQDREKRSKEAVDEKRKNLKIQFASMLRTKLHKQNLLMNLEKEKAQKEAFPIQKSDLWHQRALSPNDRMFVTNDREPNPDEIFQAEQDLNQFSLIDKDIIKLSGEEEKNLNFDQYDQMQREQIKFKKQQLQKKRDLLITKLENPPNSNEQFDPEQIRNYLRIIQESIQDLATIIQKFQDNWKKEEDKILINLVQVYGEKQWNLITDYLPGRLPIECKRRYLILSNLPKQGK